MKYNHIKGNLILLTVKSMKGKVKRWEIKSHVSHESVNAPPHITLNILTNKN